MLKLKQIVQQEAAEINELLDFAEQERLTLLEKEAALEEELMMVSSSRRRGVCIIQTVWKQALWNHKVSLAICVPNHVFVCCKELP